MNKLETIELPLSEFHSVINQLKELTHVTVDAWTMRDDVDDGLERVLTSLHNARRNLETAPLLCAPEQEGKVVQ